MNLLKMINLMENLNPNALVGFLKEYLKDPYDLDNLLIAADYLQEMGSPLGEVLKDTINKQPVSRQSWSSVIEKLERKGIEDRPENIIAYNNNHYSLYGDGIIRKNSSIFNINELKEHPELAEGLFYLIARRVRYYLYPEDTTAKNYREKAVLDEITVHSNNIFFRFQYLAEERDVLQSSHATVTVWITHCEKGLRDLLHWLEHRNQFFNKSFIDPLQRKLYEMLQEQLEYLENEGCRNFRNLCRLLRNALKQLEDIIRSLNK